jgi:Rrf2 family protein
MKLSKRGEYGLKAMIELATRQPEYSVVQIKEIATHEQIPVKFLEQIMVTLKNAGLLHSKAGVGGGYHLARPATEITLGQIVRVLDGPLAPIRCVSQMAYERCVCEDESTCGLRLAMLDVRNAIADILDKSTLAEVAARQKKAEAHEQRRTRPKVRAKR